MRFNVLELFTYLGIPTTAEAAWDESLVDGLEKRRFCAPTAPLALAVRGPISCRERPHAGDFVEATTAVGVVLH
jgi:hypothetical protein